MGDKASQCRRDKDVRCKSCNALLATTDGSALTFRRGGLQVVVDGDFHVSIVCYGVRCNALTVLNIKSEDDPHSGPA